MESLLTHCRSFVHEDDGAQVIEYALLIALISIALIIGIQGLNGNFGTVITRIANCVSTSSCV